MSRTELYVVKKNGDVIHHKDFHNSHRGALKCWMTIAKHYLKLKGLGFTKMMMDDTEMNKVWNLANNKSVLWNDRVVLASTFDNIVVKKKNIPKLIESFKDYCKRYDGGNFADQIQEFESLKKKKIHGICWNQTSIGEQVLSNVFKQKDKICYLFENMEIIQ